MPRKHYEPGAVDAYLNIIEVDRVGDSLVDTLYKAHWHCHDEDVILTHTQITKRMYEARHNGRIGPCFGCSRKLKLGGRMAGAQSKRHTLYRPERRDKAAAQRRSWLRVPVAAAWPRPAGNGQALVWGTQY
jgi:hypothetical protein